MGKRKKDYASLGNDFFRPVAQSFFCLLRSGGNLELALAGKESCCKSLEKLFRLRFIGVSVVVMPRLYFIGGTRIC